MNKWKNRTSKVMNLLTGIESGVMLVSGLASCGNWIYLVPFLTSVVALLYTRLWMRRWNLE